MPWGRGLATEASLAVLPYGFEVLAYEQIWAHTDPPNIASQWVIQWLGMQSATNPSAGAPPTVAYVIERATFQNCSRDL